MGAETGTGRLLAGSTTVAKLDSRSAGFCFIMAATTVAQACATRF
jgi:hypothetical protein